MRDYTGSPFMRLDPEIRAAISPIDYFLRDLSRGIRRIENGEVPSGSGNPLPGSLVLPDEPGALLFIDPGPVLGTDVDRLFWNDADHLLGVGTGAPTAVLHLAQAGTTPMLATATNAVGNWGVAGAGTAHAAVATNDSGTSTVFINNLGVGTNPTVLRLGFDFLSPSVPLYTVRVWIRQDNALNPGGTVGATSNIAVQMRLNDGNTFNASPSSLLMSAIPIETTVASGSTAFTAYDFAIDTTGIPPGGLVSNNEVGIAFGYDGAAGYDLTFRITLVEVFEGAAGDAFDLTRWYTSSGATLSAWVDENAIFNIPQLNLLDATGDALSIVPASATTAHTLTMPGTQGAADTILKNDGSGTLSWVTLSSLGGAFADDVFRVVDNADATKKLAFEVSGVTTATTRTMTVPNASGTLAILSLAQTFTAAQTIDLAGTGEPLNLEKASGTDNFIVGAHAGIGDIFTIEGSGAFNLAGAIPLISWASSGVIGSGDFVALSFEDLTPASGGTTLRLPNAAGTTDMTFVFTNATQTLQAKTLNSCTIGVTTEANASTSSSGFAVQDLSTPTKLLRWILSTAVGSNVHAFVNTAARTYTFTDISGNVLTDTNVTVDDNGDVVTFEGEVVVAV